VVLTSFSFFVWYFGSPLTYPVGVVELFQSTQTSNSVRFGLSSHYYLGPFGRDKPMLYLQKGAPTSPSNFMATMQWLHIGVVHYLNGNFLFFIQELLFHFIYFIFLPD